MTIIGGDDARELVVQNHRENQAKTILCERINLAFPPQNEVEQRLSKLSPRRALKRGSAHS